MVSGIDFERFFGPPKYFVMLYGPQSLKSLGNTALRYQDCQEFYDCQDLVYETVKI
jgi:hypothetical protein